jgi:hypothetical protein
MVVIFYISYDKELSVYLCDNNVFGLTQDETLCDKRLMRLVLHYFCYKCYSMR